MPKSADAPRLASISVRIEAQLPSVEDTEALRAASKRLAAALGDAGATGSLLVTGSTVDAEAFTDTYTIAPPSPE